MTRDPSDACSQQTPFSGDVDGVRGVTRVAMARNLTMGGEHTMGYSYALLLNYTPETCWIVNQRHHKKQQQQQQQTVQTRFLPPAAAGTRARPRVPWPQPCPPPAPSRCFCPLLPLQADLGFTPKCWWPQGTAPHGPVPLVNSLPVVSGGATCHLCHFP